MQKKLTLAVDKDVYDGLFRVVRLHKISHFEADLVCPHALHQDLCDDYRAMAADCVRESEALEWAESTCGDTPVSRHETRCPSHHDETGNLQAVLNDDKDGRLFKVEDAGRVNGYIWI